jgi:ABC-type multidrug transport system fused ATPase/permease subunit
MLHNFDLWLRNSTVIRSLNVLPKSDRSKIVFVMALQVALGCLDLLGVAAIGVLGALSVTGVQSLQPGNRVSKVLETLGLENLTFQEQVAILGLAAAGILITRTILSIIVTRKVFYFLSRRGAMISSDLVSRLLSQSLLKIQMRSGQETLYALTSGVNSIMLGVLGTATTLVADGSLLIIMLIGLFVVDPTIALTTLLFFGSMGLVLYRIMNIKAHKLGYLKSELEIASNEKIIEVLDSYRESVVRNRRNFYSREIGKLRLKLANVLAELQFMPNISKYVIESGIVIGAVLIAGVQFAFQDARHAVATLSVFLASGTRIAPAIMRLQQSLVQIKSGIGSAMPTLVLIESLKNVPLVQVTKDDLEIVHKGFRSEVILTDISLIYPAKETNALTSVSFQVSAGTSVAIVGPSGAGKTSLVDVLLGVLPPSSGSVSISGVNPLDAISTWPGAISYVPQDVSISNGTFRENVGLGYPKEVISDELVWAALEVAQLAEFVRALPSGLDTQVGERGTKISGGQRQRLGIARAMFTQPKLLVLDEATSALDGQTEADISEAIQGLKGSVTVVMIAHRLSTVRNADQVLYMDGGKLVSQGTFEEVRSEVPDFDKQAKLMGL